MRPFFMFLVVLLISNNAKALINEKLYFSCKPFVENNFKQTDNPTYDGVCMGYFNAIMDAGSAFCSAGHFAKNEGDTSGVSNFLGTEFGFEQTRTSIKAGIQQYVNDMQINTKVSAATC